MTARSISRSASARASISPTAPICCPTTASSAASRSSTASRTALGPCPRQAARQCPAAHGRRARRAAPHARRRAELRLPAPPRPVAQGAPRQAADGQRRARSTCSPPSSSPAASCASPPTIRSICDWSLMVMQRHVQRVRMARGAAGGFPGAAGRLDRDPLRRQVAARRPPALLSSLSADFGLEFHECLIPATAIILVINCLRVPRRSPSPLRIYCVAYTSLAGRAESAVEAFGWAIANVLPWLLSIEAGKRCRLAAIDGGRLAAPGAYRLAGARFPPRVRRR